MKLTARVILAFATFAPVTIAQQQPAYLVNCGSTDRIPFEAPLTVVVNPGADPVSVASSLIASLIASSWGCRVCGTWPDVWSCQKGTTGPANPDHFTHTEPPHFDEETGVWTFVGVYSGHISVSCKEC